jgi:hypothetical protein
VRVGQRPERRAETQSPDGANERPRVFGDAAVNAADVSADGSILPDVAREALADFHLEALRGDVVEHLPDLPIVGSTIATTFSSLWNGMATVGALMSRAIIGRSAKLRGPPLAPLLPSWPPPTLAMGAVPGVSTAASTCGSNKPHSQAESFVGPS